MKHELLEQMFDNGVRISQVIHIKGACIDSESPSQVFKDFYEEDLPAVSDVEYLYKQWPKLYQAIGSDDYIPAQSCPEFALYLLMYCPFEFLVQIQYQFIHYIDFDPENKRNWYAAGWGHYRQEWCFANTMDEAAEFAVECSEQHRKEQQARFLNSTSAEDDALPF